MNQAENEKLWHRIHENYGDEYFNEKVSWLTANVWRRQEDSLIAALEEIAEQRNSPITYLDIGSGTGSLYRRLPMVAQYYGIEPIPEIRARCVVADNATVVDGMAESLPDIVRSNSIHVVVIKNAFDHFQDAPRALSEISRVLCSDGRLVISNSSADSYIEFIKRFLPYAKHDHNHMLDFRMDYVRASLAMHSMEIETVRSLGFAIMPEMVHRLVGSRASELIVSVQEMLLSRVAPLGGRVIEIVARKR